MDEQVLIVSTPIGNLDDMTIRGVRALEQADVILCEDTRHSLKLLSHFGIRKKLVSYHKFNERERVDYILSLIDEEKKIALISDAGTPLISDPGSVLVEEMIRNGISFSVVPGANALLPALILSGLDSENFTFAGFLPKKASRKKTFLENYRELSQTLIFYSSPHELSENLSAMKEVFGNRKAAACREITKLHEETVRDDLDGLIRHFTEISPKGEFVIVVEGLREEEKTASFNELRKIFDERAENGERPKEIIKALSREYNVNKRELYSYIMTK